MTEDTQNKKAQTKSLTDDAIETTPNQSRRTMLRAFGIGALGLGASTISGCIVIDPFANSNGGRNNTNYGNNQTDNDSGFFADPVGGGSGGGGGTYTGRTDTDSGNNADLVGYGRR